MTKPLADSDEQPDAISNAPETGDFGGALGSSFALLASRGALMAFAVLANLIAARALGPSGRGQIAAALQVSYLCSFLVVLGLDRALPMVAPAVPVSDSLSVARQAMRRRSLLMVGAGIGFSAVGMASGQMLLVTFSLAISIMAVFNGHFRVIEAALINADRSRAMVPIQILSGATTLVLLASLALSSISEVGFWFSAYVLSSIVVVFVAHRRHARPLANIEVPRIDQSALDRSQWSRAGIRLLPASMAGFATLRSDRLLLPLLSGSEELGLYVVVATFVDLASVPIESLANVLLPRWRARQLAGGLRARRELVFSLAIAVLLAGGVWIFGTMLVVPVFGEEYERSRSFLPLLAVAAFLLGASRLSQSRALAIGFDSLVSLAETCGVLSAFATYVVLIPSLGAQGAALGSVVGYGTTLVVVTIGQFVRSSEP